MSYTAKQWTITLRIMDALAAALIVFLSYLVWSFYRESGQIELPLGISTFFWIAVFIVLRGIAKKEKRKAEAVEAEIRKS